MLYKFSIGDLVEYSDLYVPYKLSMLKNKTVCIILDVDAYGTCTLNVDGRYHHVHETHLKLLSSASK